MKKYTLIAFMLFFAILVKAQPTQFTLDNAINQLPADSSSYVTVKDSTFTQDARLNFMVQTIYPAINNFIEEYNSKVKLEGKEITKKAETNQFVKKYEKLLADYQLNFLEVKDVQVDSLKVITELQALDQEVLRIDSDQEIKLSDAKKKVAEIRLRQAKLASYYNQITQN